MKNGKKKFAVVAALALVFGLLSAAPASAGPRMTAADFAADCNDDGAVAVEGRQVYRGGTGTLDGACSISLAPGARLVFKNVDIDGVGGLAAISSPADTTIKVVRSSFDIDGPLELTAGCCSGEGDGSEQNGRVVVKRSTFVADSIQLVASFDDAEGRVVVRRSSLTATGDLGIQLRASDLSGTDGVVRVHRSQLDSAGALQISTGTNGRTVVRRTASAFVGEPDVRTGLDGRCVSRRNIPDLPCLVVVPDTGVEEEEPAEEEEIGSGGVEPDDPAAA